MHSIIKSMFYIVFIIVSLTAGVSMLLKPNGSKKLKIFGLMVLLLGVGESFHLVPRLIQIFSNDSVDWGDTVETGRFIASLAIIFVYLLLFRFWKVYYNKSTSNNLNITVIILGFIAAVFSVLFKNTEESLIIVLRNLPTMVIGIIIVVQFKKQATTNHPFKYLWLALLLSMLFLLGFELLNMSYPFFIILMMPKILMYIWIVYMGYIAYRQKVLI